MMHHKGYYGTAVFDDEAGVFHGRVIGIRDVVTFEGRSVQALTKAFRESIDDYLALCRERGEEPNKPFSGKLSLRVGPTVHRKISAAAGIAGKSINSWIAERLEEDAEKVLNNGD